MAEFWEKTIEVYGNFIDYPQLTEKYLKRPPFKYLFQIFISLNSKTNFADGLFKEPELDPEFYDSPEKKMHFLKQILKLVYKLAGKECQLKPQSVIKGVDCDKTNEFLQDMFVAATSGKSGAKTNMESEQQHQSPVNPAKLVTSPTLNSNTSKDKNPGPVNPKAKPARLATQETKDIEVLEAPETITLGKENLKDKAKDPKVGKLTKQIREEQTKEQKLITREDTDKKGSSAESNIKMGSLNTIGQSQPKNPVGNLALPSEKLTSENKGLNLDEIKEIIQKITQNAHPLGKLIEFIDDDLDGMSKEFKRWQKLFFESSSKLENMENEQNDELQTYNDKITELNEQIFDQENKILSIRSRILKNNQKIENMLSKIVHN